MDRTYRSHHSYCTCLSLCQVANDSVCPFRVVSIRLPSIFSKTSMFLCRVRLQISIKMAQASNLARPMPSNLELPPVAEIARLSKGPAHLCRRELYENRVHCRDLEDRKGSNLSEDRIVFELCQPLAINSARMVHVRPALAGET